MKVGDLELFFHLCGVIYVFLGFGTLLLATVALARSSRVEQVRAIMTPLVAGRRIGPEQISVIDVIVVSGVLLIVSTGIAMARANNYVWSSWVEVATASLILLAPVGPFVIKLRLHAIAEEAEREADGALLAALRDRISSKMGFTPNPNRLWLLGATRWRRLGRLVRASISELHERVQSGNGLSVASPDSRPGGK